MISGVTSFLDYLLACATAFGHIDREQFRVGSRRSLVYQLMARERARDHRISSPANSLRSVSPKRVGLERNSKKSMQPPARRTSSSSRRSARPQQVVHTTSESKKGGLIGQIEKGIRYLSGLHVGVETSRCFSQFPCGGSIPSSLRARSCQSVCCFL